MNKPPGARALNTNFQHEHTVTFGLKVTQKNITTGAVISVRCEFCVYFGHEVTELDRPRLRAKKETQKSWTNNFRTELYRNHMRGEHKAIWEKYQTCSYEDKVNFFNEKVAMKNTLLNHFDGSKPIQYAFNTDIIEVLICDMFFHPDDHGGVTQTAAKNLFQQFEGQYRVTISNPIQFHLVVAQIARGTSFRQVVGVISDIKEITGTCNCFPG